MITSFPEAQAQESEEPIFELSAFEVSVADDWGYFSPTSVVATGFSQEIYKTPLNISTLTDQFLEDTGIDNLNDAIGYRWRKTCPSLRRVTGHGGSQPVGRAAKGSASIRVRELTMSTGWR